MNSIDYKISFGQFFTPKPIALFMVSLLEVDKNAHILEPASGEGIFLDVLQEVGFKHISAYEIDNRLISHGYVKNESFLSARLPENYFDAIIGNPPYIRWKNLNQAAKDELANHELWQTYFNSLCDYLYIFILKSILLLKDGGELIFICPDYWLSTKHAIGLRRFMLEQGGFEKIIRFYETPIFPRVNSSIMIFHYRKNRKPEKIQFWQCENRTKLNDEQLRNLEILPDIKKIFIPQFDQAESWLFTDEETTHNIRYLEEHCKLGSENYPTIGDICDIGNGMVSGLDKAFQTKLNGLHTPKEYAASIQVAKAKHLNPYYVSQTTDYIFVQENLSEAEFAAYFPNFHQDLQPYREQLNKRYSYGKTLTYWQWAFLRNYVLFSRPEARIFVPCKERITHKNHFRFALAEAHIYPTQDVTALLKKNSTLESLEYIVAYLNQSSIFDWLKHKGVIKGGIVEFSEKPLASIPFRKIDWKNTREVAIHEQISQAVKNYSKSMDTQFLDFIKEQFKQLGVL